MLYDPKWEKKPTPSLDGFRTFVAIQAMRNPEGQYYWPDSYLCAVGQYLWAIGCYRHSWHREAGLLRCIDLIAYGGRMRDRHGRFTSHSPNAVWRWRDLHNRLKELP